MSNHQCDRFFVFLVLFQILNSAIVVSFEFAPTRKSRSAFLPNRCRQPLLPHESTVRPLTRLSNTKEDAGDNSDEVSKEKKRARVMAFLRNVGAVGANKDFSTVSHASFFATSTPKIQSNVSYKMGFEIIPGHGSR